MTYENYKRARELDSLQAAYQSMILDLEDKKDKIKTYTDFNQIEITEIYLDKTAHPREIRILMEYFLEAIDKTIDYYRKRLHEAEEEFKKI